LDQVVSFLFKYKEALLSKGQFGFGTRPSVFLLILLVAALGLFLYLIYASRTLRLSPGWRAGLIALRCLLIAVIVFCVMRPVVVIPSVVPQSTYVAVVVDDSASMLLPDEDGGARLDTVKRLLSADSGFTRALSDKFKVRLYRFSSLAEQVSGDAELSAAGTETNLAAALDQVTRDSAGLPFSGMVLISDGASNAESDLTADLSATLNNIRARRLPVYTIGVGQKKIEGDVELVRATAPRRALKNSPVTVELLVKASGDQRTVKIDITEDNHLLRSQSVPVPAEGTAVARITFTPSSAGLHRYRFFAPPAEGDPIAENNSQELLIEVQDARPRILYIEGEPRWEYGKMRESLSEEKNITLVSILRSAEGKYYRQGVTSGEELASGFPKSEAELFKFDALVLGSIEATFFSFEQLKAIEQFVSRRGGTLIALGGTKSFNAGGYQNTPLADLLPVYLRGQVAGGESQTFKAGPADRGRDHPATRLVEDSEASQAAWQQLPPVTLPEVITEIKPGATVVLEGRSTKDRNQSAPVLVEERYGRGRTLAMLASDTWRWQMMMESKDKSFETFWRNLLRYLVDPVRTPVEATTERSYYGTGEQVRIRAEVSDENFVRVGDASATASITAPSGDTFEVLMKPNSEGDFDGHIAGFVPDEEGLYRVEVKPARTSKQGGPLMTAQSNFLVGPINREARDAAQNEELLKRIASETGGGYYSSSQAGGLVEDLAHTEGPGTVRETKDLWDMPINFLLVVGLAAGEWFIRKRKGLA
jgi:uncharacterized membrane protein